MVTAATWKGDSWDTPTPMCEDVFFLALLTHAEISTKPPTLSLPSPPGVLLYGESRDSVAPDWKS